MDNGAMEKFFGRVKVEMFYGEKFESVNTFIIKRDEPCTIQNSFICNLIFIFV